MALRRQIFESRRSMNKIRKKILRDADQRPVAVQIDYADWLKIEMSLDMEPEEIKMTDLTRYEGVLPLTEEPLAYQARVRNEWS